MATARPQKEFPRRVWVKAERLSLNQRDVSDWKSLVVMVWV